MIWFLYVIRTVDNCLYTGITTDVQRRFNEHRSAGRKTARYLLAHKPQHLAFYTSIGNRSLALRVEYRFKKLAKKDKEKIIRKGKLNFNKETGEITL